jgi:hypothetical protein
MDTVSSPGQMGASTMACGKTGNRTERGGTLTKKGTGVWESGVVAVELTCN